MHDPDVHVCRQPPLLHIDKVHQRLVLSLCRHTQPSAVSTRPFTGMQTRGAWQVLVHYLQCSNLGISIVHRFSGVTLVVNGLQAAQACCTVLPVALMHSTITVPHHLTMLRSRL